MLVNARPVEYCCNLCSIPDSSVFRSSGPSLEIASCWYLTASAKLPVSADAAARVSIEKAFFQPLSLHAFIAIVTARRPSLTRLSFEVASIHAKSFNVVGSSGWSRTACSKRFFRLVVMPVVDTTPCFALVEFCQKAGRNVSLARQINACVDLL